MSSFYRALIAKKNYSKNIIHWRYDLDTGVPKSMKRVFLGKDFKDVVCSNPAVAVDGKGYLWYEDTTTKDRFSKWEETAARCTKVFSAYNYIDDEGFLFVYGDNRKGQLGIQDTEWVNKGTQMGENTWKKIFYNNNNQCTYGIDTNDHLWGWGTSSFLTWCSGKSPSPPVQIGTKTWKHIVFRGDYNINHALDTDGILWAWGSNEKGQLGLPIQDNITAINTPTQVSTKIFKNILPLDFRRADGILALDEQDKLFFVGEGTVKQIGEKTWIDVVEVDTFAFYGLDTDGILWAWGSNKDEKLGIETPGYATVSEDAPIQLDNRTWKSLVFNGYLALDSFCRLWRLRRNSSEPYNPKMLGKLALKNISEVNTDFGLAINL